MVTTVGFFGASTQSAHQLTTVDLGGQGDSCFRAAAAAMIDNIFTKPAENIKLAESLCLIHSIYFQQREIPGRSTTFADLLKSLVQLPVRAKFLHELAYALRQITVDELCVHPERYRSAFVSLHGTITLETLRSQGTWPDEATVIAALAAAIKLPITVKKTSSSDELALRSLHEPLLGARVGSSITLHLKNESYLAEVNNSSYFVGLSLSIAPVITPKGANGNHEFSLTHLLQKIISDEQRILSEFESTSKRLQIMVKAGELSKEQLLSIYIHEVVNCSGLAKSTNYAGIEHGHQKFFELIEMNRNEGRQANRSEKGYEQLFLNELIHALSRAVALGQLDPALIYGEESDLSFTR